jgi:hypothetical protein
MLTAGVFGTEAQEHQRQAAHSAVLPVTKDTPSARILPQQRDPGRFGLSDFFSRDRLGECLHAEDVALPFTRAGQARIAATDSRAQYVADRCTPETATRRRFSGSKPFHEDIFITESHHAAVILPVK